MARPKKKPAAEVAPAKAEAEVAPAKVERLERTQYLGGYAPSIILGCNPFETEKDLWDFYVNGKTKQETPAMAWGLRLEDAVLKHTASELGAKVSETQKFVSEGIFGGTIDAVAKIGDEEFIIDAKTTSMDWGSDIPPTFQLQAQWYMAFNPKWRKCYFGVLRDGRHFSLHCEIRDDKIIGEIRDICAKWWQDYVIGGIEPMGVSAQAEKVAERIKAPKDVLALAAPEMEPLFLRLIELNKVIAEKEAEFSAEAEEVKALKETIILKMQAAEQRYVAFKGGTARLSIVAGRKSCDYDELSATFPKAFAHCVTTGKESARLSVRVANIS